MATDPARDAVPLYDLRGLTCPLPVLKAAKRLRGMRPGSRLWVETTDPLAAIDIPAFCREAGHVLLDVGTTASGHRFLIAKAKEFEKKRNAAEPSA